MNFGEGIIDVTNQSKDYNYTLSAQLSKRFSEAFQLQGSYTYMKAMDVQSLTSDRAISNFRNGAQFAGNFNDMEPTTSYFSRPHRLVLSGTYTAPWKTTDLSFYIEGISGTPYTYVYSGDMNGDGVTQNDPIYVPTDATNAEEIKIGTLSNGVFTKDVAAANQFAEFIAMQPVPGRAARPDHGAQQLPQPVPEAHGRVAPPVAAADRRVARARLALQLDMFNFLGLLKEDWGRLELPTLSGSFPQQAVLVSTGTGTNTGRLAGPLNQSMPVVGFNATVANMTGTEPTDLHQADQPPPTSTRCS